MERAVVRLSKVPANSSLPSANNCCHHYERVTYDEIKFHFMLSGTNALFSLTVFHSAQGLLVVMISIWMVWLPGNCESAIWLP